ncbi:hypothetical protein [Ornithinimicrobium cryptoxanthini]|uniref:Uncharacterized protein n=1 Tax=Ornithinimicrobium cryptoxanthini TaxID=2934161 RepID=A0ABY4YE78_9MICO|nr:hypothetical protein [Ornithinimicrobium cryptoxanthini]USQ74865.1 hypothetical protein NF557_09305 [Ornithinimicrobium cryptoxanthini]
MTSRDDASEAYDQHMASIPHKAAPHESRWLDEYRPSGAHESTYITSWLDEYRPAGAHESTQETRWLDEYRPAGRQRSTHEVKWLDEIKSQDSPPAE